MPTVHGGYNDSHAGLVQDDPDEKTAQIFISHAREDRERVNELYRQLQSAGYRPWIDTKDLLGGQEWDRVITDAVEESDFFLICLSEASHQKRGQVQREIRLALKQMELRRPGDIFLIPVRLDEVELPEEIDRYQAIDLFPDEGYADGFERLKTSLAAQGFPGIDVPATPPEKRTPTGRTIRRPAFDRSLPGYLLDDSYHFVDWNPAFDEIVAKPLGLRRGGHAFEFVSKLANCQQVIERSKIVFGPGEDPLTDQEVLLLDSPTYGMITFQKLACQIPDRRGSAMAWSVSLNVLSADSLPQLFHDIGERLDREMNWSRYAKSYDELLLEFDQYHKLLKTVIGLLGQAKRCLDLGAGTGNSTAELLRQDPEREVWAVELNQDMVDLLRTNIRCKLQFRDSADEFDSFSAGLEQIDRVTILKEDISRLDDVPSQYFDAVVLVNVLYATDNPRKCLEHAYRLLKPGGVLTLSTSHRDTDVDRLFKAIRTELQAKGHFEEMRPCFESAYASHTKMLPQIHRDTKDDIRGYLESTGFRIEKWLDDQYEEAVVVVRAVRS